MIDLKTVAGGIAIAGSLGLATLGLGSATANADPSPMAPSVSSAQPAGQGGNHAVSPSPYAAYGPSICGTPGLYFVNVCQ